MYAAQPDWNRFQNDSTPFQNYYASIKHAFFHAGIQAGKIIIGEHLCKKGKIKHHTTIR